MLGVLCVRIFVLDLVFCEWSDWWCFFYRWCYLVFGGGGGWGVGEFDVVGLYRFECGVEKLGWIVGLCCKCLCVLVLF